MQNHASKSEKYAGVCCDPECDKPGLCAILLTLASAILILITMPISLCWVIKVVKEYERAVIFRWSPVQPPGPQAGQDGEWRTKGSWGLLHHPLHRCLRED